MTLLRPLLAFVAVLIVALGHAGTLTVTSPSDNGYLGLSNSVQFNLSGASTKVRVTVVATPPSGNAITLFKDVTPNNDGTASGSIDLSFNAGATEGKYTLAVSASEPNNGYASTTLSETVDVTAPKFTELSPVTGGYTRGPIKVRATLEEANLDSWTVVVNSQTIATGSSTDIAADYDASTLPTDGPQNIVITATDLAGNSLSRTISVTLDRQKPTVQIVFPSNNGSISGDLNVIVDITDASSTSVDRTGIDVLVEKPDGTYVARVTLVSLRATSGTVQRWTGRVRYRKGLFPSTFLVSVSVIDRAGNAAFLQQVSVRSRK